MPRLKIISVARSGIIEFIKYITGKVITIHLAIEKGLIEGLVLNRMDRFEMRGGVFEFINKVAVGSSQIIGEDPILDYECFHYMRCFSQHKRVQSPRIES